MISEVEQADFALRLFWIHFPDKYINKQIAIIFTGRNLSVKAFRSMASNCLQQLQDSKISYFTSAL